MKAAQISRKSLNELLLLHKNGEAKTDAAILSNYLQEFEDAINDDLNLPLALGVLWKMTKEEKSRDVFLAAVKMDEVFGLGFKDLKEEAAENDFPKEVILLAEERLNARNAKDFAKSDCLREEIRQLGFEIKDSKDTYFLSKI
ncbi:MAG: DALR domain-containing protein [Clostridia bacterium]